MGEELKENQNIITGYEIALDDFCNRYNVEDIRRESQNVFNAFLIYLNKNRFVNTQDFKYKTPYDKTKITPTNNNIYNYDVINKLLDEYIELSLLCDKEVNINSFSLLSGISLDCIYSWCDKYKRVEGLTCTPAEIYQKLLRFNEDTLSSNLTSGKKNPVGSIAKLNSKFNWNSNGYSRQDTGQAKTLEELPSFGLIGQNAQQKTDQKQTEKQENI